MNRKNLILTVLACLNCVHTTYAVESTPVAIQKLDQDELKARDQFAFLLFMTGYRLNHSSMIKDALRQMKNIDVELDDEIPQNDPKRRLFKSLVTIRHDIAQYLANLKEKFSLDGAGGGDLPVQKTLFEEKFEEKLKELDEREKIPGLNVNMTHDRPYTRALASTYPKLFYPYNGGLTKNLDYFIIHYSPITKLASDLEEKMQVLEKDPDLAKQALGLQQKNWALDLNDRISANRLPNNIGYIFKQLDESPTKIAQAFKETILHTIRQNLNLAEGDVLHQRTVEMLSNDRILFNRMRNDAKDYLKGKMPLLHAYKTAQNLGAEKKRNLANVTDNIFTHDVAKYL